MKELIECKDLLKSERVKAAAKGLVVDLEIHMKDVIYQGSWPKPLEVVAFQMRDACSKRGIWIVEYMDGSFADDVDFEDVDAWHWMAHRATARHWIIAVTLAWEVKK